MTLVSSANNIGSDMEFILSRQAFIHIENRGPKIDPWETPYFSVPLTENKLFIVPGDLLKLSVFY
jgi:4-diphosphocytidyl-2C-methyl-D-erythritol kinase